MSSSCHRTDESVSRDGRSAVRGAPSARRRGSALTTTAAVLLAAVLGFPPAAAAQGVDGGEFTAPDTAADSVGWAGTADFGLTVTSGNSETTTVSASARITRRFVLHTLGLSTSYLRTTDEGAEVANRGDLGASYRYFPSRGFYLTARAAGSFNEPAGLELRLAPGAGAGVVVAEGEGYQLSAEAGASWIRDQFVDETTTTSIFYGLAESFSLRVSETTSLEQELRYNPRADDLSDYLLHAEATLTTRITEAIGIRLRVIDDYDATPFEGAPEEEPAEKNDLTLITGLSVQW